VGKLLNMPVCIIPNCFSGSKRKGLSCDPKIHLHRFPKDVGMRALWLEQIQHASNVIKEINCDTGKLFVYKLNLIIFLLRPEA